jgi:hypothetical protein
LAKPVAGIINNLSIRRTQVATAVHIAHAAANFSYYLPITYRTGTQYYRAVGKFFNGVFVGREGSIDIPAKTIWVGGMALR